MSIKPAQQVMAALRRPKGTSALSAMMPPNPGAGDAIREDKAEKVAKSATAAQVEATEFGKLYTDNEQFAAYRAMRARKDRLNSLLTALYRLTGDNEGAAARIQEYLYSPESDEPAGYGQITELLALVKNGLSPEIYANRLRGIRVRVEQLNFAMGCLALNVPKPLTGLEVPAGPNRLGYEAWANLHRVTRK